MLSYVNMKNQFKFLANRHLLDETYSSILKWLDSTNQEFMNWRRKYEQVSSRQRTEQDHEC